MEFHNIFSDNMHIRRPPLGLIILDERQIVKKCIIPHICHLSRIEWEGYTELVGLTRDREVFESSLYELYNLVESRTWLHEVRIFFIKIKDLLLILRESEKIIFLREMLEWFIRVIRTLSIDEIGIFFECFTSDTIESLILPLIDVSVIE